MTNRILLLLALLLMVFLTAGILRLNDLSVYSDSTRYLIWANSLASGDGFLDDTRPVPTRFVMNAPLYAVLLSPVELLAPLSVTAAKVWTLLFAAGALVLMFLWLRTHVPPSAALLATGFLAFNPLYLITGTEILSEAPFICAGIALLWLFERHLQGPPEDRPRVLLLALIALLPLLREVGAAFVLAAFVALFREKRGRSLLLAALPAALLFLLWTVRNLIVASDEPGESVNLQFLLSRFVTGPDDSIVSELEARFWLNLRGYGWTIGASVFHPFPDDLIVQPSGHHQWFQGMFETLRPVLTLAAAGLIGHGIVLDRPSTPGGFMRLFALVAYLGIILLYPVHDVRFLLPILPLVLLYMSRSVVDLSGRIPAGARRAVVAVLAVTIILPNGSTVAELVRTNLAYRADVTGFSASSEDALWFGQPWAAVGDWFQQNTPVSSVIASPAKDLAVFVDRRKVVEASRALPTPILERLLRDHAVDYLVTTIAWDNFQTFEIAMAESRRLRYEPVHEVAHVRIYRVRSAFLDPPPVPLSLRPDTSTVRGKILRGREKLHALDYDGALSLFWEASQMEPGEPEPVFQVMTVLSIAGDSAGAMDLSTQLFTYPKSTAYSAMARAQIGAMLQLRRAEREKGIQRGYTAFEAGLAYWSIGYGSTALAIMRNIARSDTTHFSAALWGCYYAKQLGDTTESFEFLKRLRKIDITAPIVADWEDMRNLELKARTTTSAEKRAAIHVSIAEVYERLELYDEALDALERAEALRPGDVLILMKRAAIFEKKKAFWGAKRTYERILVKEPGHSGALEGLGRLE